METSGRAGTPPWAIATLLFISLCLLAQPAIGGPGVELGDAVRIVTADTEVIEGEILDKTPTGYLVKETDGSVQHVLYEEILALKQLRADGAGSRLGGSSTSPQLDETELRASPRTRASGVLLLSSQPVLRVEIDGIDHGSVSPDARSIPVQPGTHSVRFVCVTKVCDDFRRRSGVKTLDVDAGEQTQYHANFYELNGMEAPYRSPTDWATGQRSQTPSDSRGAEEPRAQHSLATNSRHFKLFDNFDRTIEYHLTETGPPVADIPEYVWKGRGFRLYDQNNRPYTIDEFWTVMGQERQYKAAKFEAISNNVLGWVFMISGGSLMIAGIAAGIDGQKTLSPIVGVLGLSFFFGGGILQLASGGKYRRFRSIGRIYEEAVAFSSSH